MVALGLFFLDFIAANLLHQWIVSSLLVYILAQLIIDKESFEAIFLLVGSVALFILRDYAENGCLGVCLIYLIPMFLLFEFVRKVLHLSNFNLYLVMILMSLFGEAIIVNKFILKQEQLLFVTILKIFVNILVGIMVFMGLRGGRSFLTLVKGERKVWTPNRIDAS